MILLSNWPALPTKGSPCRSSSAPGASPTKTILACGLPTPNTVCVRVDDNSPQRVQLRTFSASTCNAFIRSSSGAPAARAPDVAVGSRESASEESVFAVATDCDKRAGAAVDGLRAGEAADCAGRTEPGGAAGADRRSFETAADAAGGAGPPAGATMWVSPARC